MKLDLSLSLPGRRHGPVVSYDRSAALSKTLGALTLVGVSDIDVVGAASISMGAMTLSGSSTIVTLTTVWRASGTMFGVPQPFGSISPGGEGDDAFIAFM